MPFRLIRKAWWSPVAAGLAIAAVSACSPGSASSAPTSSTTTMSSMPGMPATTALAPGAPVAVSQVTIDDFAFAPAKITIQAGTTVTWTNNDSVDHTVTADGGAFDSGAIDTKDTFSFTFTAPGTYPYHCSIHPSMHGSVVVSP